MARVPPPSVLRTVVDNVDDFNKRVKELTGLEVLVGFPEDTTLRDDTSPMTNATLAYIHDNGAPEANIPARPFMIPGMEAAAASIEKALHYTANQALNKSNSAPDAVNKGLVIAGSMATLSIRRKISEGIPPPLAASTLRDRARRGRKGAKEELRARSAGVAPSMTLAKPLIDTGQLRNAVTFVIRRRRRREK